MKNLFEHTSSTWVRYSSYEYRKSGSILFFPFHSPDVVKRGVQSRWNISDDQPMMALAMALANRPMSVNLCCQRQYAERYDWILQVLQDWAFTFLTSFLYYLDKERMDDLSKEIFHKGMSAFGGSAPTYHIELREHPTMVWDFHSLLLQVQMLFSVMLTNDSSTMRCCPNCGKVFVAENGGNDLCPECRSR